MVKVVNRKNPLHAAAKLPTCKVSGFLAGLNKLFSESLCNSLSAKPLVKVSHASTKMSRVGINYHAVSKLLNRSTLFARLILNHIALRTASTPFPAILSARVVSPISNP